MPQGTEHRAAVDIPHACRTVLPGRDEPLSRRTRTQLPGTGCPRDRRRAEAAVSRHRRDERCRPRLRQGRASRRGCMTRRKRVLARGERRPLPREDVRRPQNLFGLRARNEPRGLGGKHEAELRVDRQLRDGRAVQLARLRRARLRLGLAALRERVDGDAGHHRQQRGRRRRAPRASGGDARQRARALQRALVQPRGRRATPGRPRRARRGRSRSGERLRLLPRGEGCAPAPASPARARAPSRTRPHSGRDRERHVRSSSPTA